MRYFAAIYRGYVRVVADAIPWCPWKVVLSGLPPQAAGAGTGTYGLFRDLAAPFGVAVFVPLFTNQITERVATGVAEPTAAVASIHFLAIAEILCVALGVAAVAFLPKQKVIKET